MNEIYLRNTEELREWLAKNYNSSKGIWLIYDKGENRTMYWSDIVDQLLCYGWIDSKPGKVDDQKSKLYIAPRNPKSNWSKMNKDKVAKLIKETLMQEAGLKMVKLAKQNGTWDALNSVDNLEIPEDIKLEFKKYSKSEKNFNNFPKSTKKGILEWILNAKQVSTRVKRIEETAKLANDNVRANQWSRDEK
jgi:uncharacterized protein YdeI (YjbR/CyaY-like superfamily)